jgi:hypothetical protein
VRARPVLALAAMLLAACTEGNTPQAECERQAMNDPDVLQIYTRTDGNYTFEGVQHTQLRDYKRQAVLRCMRAKGLVPPGGVQPVIPR